jgi:hypothetical protein
VIRKRVKFPERSIKTEETFIVSKIDYTVRTLPDIPVLGSRIVSLFGIVDDFRKTDGVLAIAV